MREHETTSSASPAVGRALDILLHLAARTAPVRASALARDLGIPRSSAYHILAILIDRGFVLYLPQEQAYGLGVAAFEIGTAYLRHEPLERLARPILHGLAHRLGHPVHLGILHGAETVYLLKEQPPGGRGGAGAALVTDVGVRLPAHLTASGRALLAHCAEAQLRAVFSRPGDLITRTGKGPRSLAELREQLARDRARGWSEETELISPGFRSVGVAAFDHHGQPVAALSSTWCRHHQPRAAAEVREALLRGAARLTAAVSGRAPSVAGDDGGAVVQRESNVPFSR
ncbi:IclR family transcriptional regulator [Streptomyces pinistramenti]|uniref:IclR family transcriptional regulator n=1 Tax=Streptomyces pinistramenti TaxID=2884812 RepID=UPI001D089ECA|nr:IclR family transcriptional regulator [Streptomyces pinistramenti]MCB5906672.1 IclR family transcriptional regulator [Streptomyces pinistramenti]